MKRFLLVAIVVPFLAQAQSNTPAASDFKKLSWLEGTWTRTNNKPGRSGHERWSRGNGNTLVGFGVSMKGQDTAFVEKLRIVVKEDRIYYVSEVPENPQPVDFLVTSITATGFVSENPKHDFPKMISYQLDGKKLKATISGDGKSMDYTFEKQQ